MKDGERSRLFELASKLKLRPVEFNSFASKLKEISLNRNTSIESLLNSNTFIEILENKDWTRVQKIHHLKKHIFDLRYPMISAYQLSMQQERSKLQFNSSMDLIYDRYFESGNIIIQLRISSLEDLLKSIEDLNSEQNVNAIKKILEKL